MVASATGKSSPMPWGVDDTSTGATDFDEVDNTNLEKILPPLGGKSDHSENDDEEAEGGAEQDSKTTENDSSSSEQQAPPLGGRNNSNKKMEPVLEWSPQSNFFADSPYYNAFVEKEIRSLELVVEILTNICNKTSEFSEAGVNMAKATRNLSMSCRLMLENESVQEGILLRSQRKKALGPDMTTLLDRLAFVLDEISRAQEDLCKNVENALGSHLTHSAISELTMACKLKEDATTETERAEQLFFKYLNGKDAGGNFENRQNGAVAGRAKRRSLESKQAFGAEMDPHHSHHNNNNQDGSNHHPHSQSSEPKNNKWGVLVMSPEYRKGTMSSASPNPGGSSRKQMGFHFPQLWRTNTGEESKSGGESVTDVEMEDETDMSVLESLDLEVSSHTERGRNKKRRPKRVHRAKSSDGLPHRIGELKTKPLLAERSKSTTESYSPIKGSLVIDTSKEALPPDPEEVKQTPSWGGFARMFKRRGDSNENVVLQDPSARPWKGSGHEVSKELKDHGVLSSSKEIHDAPPPAAKAAEAGASKNIDAAEEDVAEGATDESLSQNDDGATTGVETKEEADNGKDKHHASKDGVVDGDAVAAKMGEKFLFSSDVGEDTATSSRNNDQAAAAAAAHLEDNLLRHNKNNNKNSVENDDAHESFGNNIEDDLLSLMSTVCDDTEEEEDPTFSSFAELPTPAPGGNNQQTATTTMSTTTDPIVEKATMLANYSQNLEQIRASQVTAELKRFELLKHFVDATYQRSYVLCEGTGTLIKDMKSFHKHCSKVVKQLMPCALQKEEKIMNFRTIHRSDKSVWQERQQLIMKTLNGFQKSAVQDTTASSWSLSLSSAVDHQNHLSNRAPPLPDPEKLKLDLVEERLKIWELPSILAASSRYHRRIPQGVLVEGWLYQKTLSLMSSFYWKKDWFIIKNGQLFLLERNPEFNRPLMTNYTSIVKICDIVLSTVRERPNEPAARFCFDIIVPDRKPMTFQARGPRELKMWTEGIRSAIEEQLFQVDAHSAELNQGIGQRYRRRSSEIEKTMFQRSFYEEIIEDQERRIKTKGQTSNSKENYLKPLVKEIMEKNPMCADCSKPKPEWVSLNLGVLMCIHCSGVHRSLGVHVSKVRSLLLDSVSEQEARLLLSLGNDQMNNIWEKGVGMQSRLEKPSIYSDREEREEWIRCKYSRKEFLVARDDFGAKRGAAEGKETSKKSLYEAARNGNVVGVATALAYGADVNWMNPDENGTTALGVCLRNLEQLREEEEEQKSSGGDGSAAARSGSHGAECVELLIQNRARVGLLDADAKRTLKGLADSVKQRENDGNSS